MGDTSPYGNIPQQQNYGGNQYNQWGQPQNPQYNQQYGNQQQGYQQYGQQNYGNNQYGNQKPPQYGGNGQQNYPQQYGYNQPQQGPKYYWFYEETLFLTEISDLYGLNCL